MQLVTVRGCYNLNHGGNKGIFQNWEGHSEFWKRKVNIYLKEIKTNFTLHNLLSFATLVQIKKAELKHIHSKINSLEESLRR